MEQRLLLANLIAEKLNGETGIVRSTADDGSMTVVLEAASQNYDYNGFEAEVSLFVPQPMDFDGITTAAASAETVAAGDTEQDMLSVTVKAKDTEPAMQVQKMAFSAEGTSALVNKASLYFGATKVGETEVSADNFEITLTTPQALVEGENVFTLKYDISDEATNGDKVSAKAVSVTALVNGTAKTENVSDAAAERTVKNEAVSHADQGTVTKTVNGSLDFYTKARSEYTELNDNSQESEGPGQTIRSTAADGSLTIVFNPNSTYSSAAGWKATVSEYQSKPMAVTAVEVEQASTADASIGAENQALLNVNVKTEGDQNAVVLSSVKLNLKGTEANISKVSLWQEDTKLGEAAAAADVTITFGEPVTLAEGDNNFVVKADIKSTATENQTIDAKVISVNAVCRCCT